MSDAALCFVAHPGPVVTDILGESLGSSPGFDVEATVSVARVYWWLANEANRKFYEGFGEEHGDGVQVAPTSDESEALGLQGDRSAPAEGVEYLGRVVSTGPADLLACLSQHRLVLGVFPGHEALDDPEEPLALLFLGPLGGEAIGMSGGVVDELREEHGTACGERPACPPQVQGRGMSVADGLLPGCFAVDRFEGECHLDELAFVGVDVAHVSPCLGRGVRRSHRPLRARGSS